jgi:hypothetical protein
MIIILIGIISVLAVLFLAWVLCAISAQCDDRDGTR